MVFTKIIFINNLKKGNGILDNEYINNCLNNNKLFQDF